MSIQEITQYVPRQGRLEYSREELLAGHPVEEPLIAGGVRCHGGFIHGHYVSPRVLNRKPAVEAWQRRVLEGGHALIDIPQELVPPHYPSYEQAKFMLQEGLVDPITRSLTIISIVEGFGARIRDLPLPDWKRSVKEDVAGTALAHLGEGLFEAHARDEAGHRNEGGHKQMWEAARDLGLDRPEVPGDVLMRMMSGGRPRERRRLFPELPQRTEELITVMANVMTIEVFAEDVFEWAKRLLGDPEISADAEGAAGMVSNIQQDEKPHVQYLRTALSELRARTLLGEDDRTELPGRIVVDRIFERQLRGIASERPREQREQLRKEVLDSIEAGPRATAVARKFDSLDSGWVFPHGPDDRIELRLETA